MNLPMFTRQMPNLITLFNLLAGTVSVFLCLQDHLMAAATMIFLAALFDFLDGTAARLLKAHSDLGRELDSLADVVSFGVAPAVLIHSLMPAGFEETGNAEGIYSLILSLLPALLVVFAAIRLARYNIHDAGMNGFRGLPTPASGLFFASLAFLYVHDQSLMPRWIYQPASLAALVILFCLLMVSTLPMISIKFKDFQWKGNEYRYLLLAFSVILLILLRWNAIPAIILAYLVFSFIHALLQTKTNTP